MARVGLIGAGGQLAEAVCAWLANLGHRVYHYRPPRFQIPGIPIRPARPAARLEGFSVSRESMASIEGRSERYNACGEAELRPAEIFVYCLPSYLAEVIGVELASVMNGKYLVNLSDRFMGTAALVASASRTRQKWSLSGAVALNSPPALAYQRNRNGPTSLLYSKPFVLAAPLEGHDASLAAELLGTVFGIEKIRWMTSTLELAFENINSIVHAVQDLDCLRNGLFGMSGSLYDPECYTKRMVARIDKIVAERDSIAKLFTTRTFRNLRAFDSSTFAIGNGFEPGTAEFRHAHPLLRSVPRPQRFTAHGFEDIGWSMVPLESLGAMAGVSTPFLSALIDEWCSLAKVDYRAIGRSAVELVLRSGARCADGQ